jgi:hypothetical protein
MYKDEQGETPLSQFDMFSKDMIAKLAGHWITSAEQLIAHSARDKGLKDLARLLELEPGELAGHVTELKKVLGPEVVAQMEQQYLRDKGMGALDPRKRDRERGEKQ